MKKIIGSILMFLGFILSIGGLFGAWPQAIGITGLIPSILITFWAIVTGVLILCWGASLGDF